MTFNIGTVLGTVPDTQSTMVVVVVIVVVVVVATGDTRYP